MTQRSGYMVRRVSLRVAPYLFFLQSSLLLLEAFCFFLSVGLTTLLPPNRATRYSDSPESPPTPAVTMSPSDRPVAIATDRALEGAVG